MLAAAAEGGSNVPAMSLAPSVGTIFQGDLLFQKQIPVMVKQQQHQPQQFSTSHLPPSSSSASMAGGSHSQASCPPTPLLFGNTVPTTFQHTQQAGTAAFCLQRRQIVTATVCFGYKNTLLSTGQQTLTSVNRPKFLQITLTDEQDPYFLYQLEIGEDEFVELKNEQNLLVDFAEFPWKFIELLEECIRAGSLDSAGGSGGATVGSPSSPKFLAQLINFSSMTTGPSARSLFTVVETNSFKHITHLSLQFLPGTDVTVKKYLASLVQSYKEQSARLQSQLSSTDSQLRAELKSMSDECGRLKESLGCLRFDSSESENRLRLQHADELGRERERLAREKEAAVRELENVKNGMMARYEQQLSQVTVQLHELQNEHSTATSRLRLVEDQLAAARLRAEELTRDNESLRTESARMREEKSESVGARQELERLLNAMRKRCEDSEAALNEKSANLARIEDSAGASRLQQAQLTEELQQYKSQANELEQQLSLSANEINKANEIIMKLQSDLKSNKSKLKLKNVVTIQQEKLIDEKQSFIDASQKEQAELKELLARRDGEVDTLRKDNDRLKAQIEEGKKVIAENNNVIEWLHKQINEEAIHKPFTVGGTITAQSAVEYNKQRRFGSSAPGSRINLQSSSLAGNTAARLTGSALANRQPALHQQQFTRSLQQSLQRPDSPTNNSQQHGGENGTILTGYNTAAATLGYTGGAQRQPLRTMGQQQMSATSASNINRKAVTSAIVDSMNSLKLQSEQNRDNDVLTGDPAVGAVRSNYF